MIVFILGCIAASNESHAASYGIKMSGFCGVWTSMILIVMMVYGSFALRMVSNVTNSSISTMSTMLIA